VSHSLYTESLTELMSPQLVESGLGILVSSLLASW
jgi:hypothetical protein